MCHVCCLLMNLLTNNLIDFLLYSYHKFIISISTQPFTKNDIIQTDIHHQHFNGKDFTFKIYFSTFIYRTEILTETFEISAITFSYVEMFYFNS